MSLSYPAEAIPEPDRCPTCNGSGDKWSNVYDAKYGTSQMEPVDECPACHGTGLRPDPRFCPECGGEGEHGRGCGYVAQALADHAFDHHGPHR